jgi:hypothetical protein
LYFSFSVNFLVKTVQEVAVVAQDIFPPVGLVVSAEEAVASAAAVVDLEEAAPQEVGNGFIK